MKDIFVLIPSYNPNEEIMSKFLNELKKEFNNILIINDGSINNSYFEELSNKGYLVIRNHKNLGKGRALKYGFNYILNEYPNIYGVVTCDCDGQHKVSDILKIAKKIKKDKDELILGVRKFKDKQIPLRSRFGNNITKFVFKTFVHLNISDTQTGLRGLNRNLMIKFLSTSGERYEYETKVLIKCKQKDIKILEVPIETIYINNNETSHFNPIKDSIKIYRLFTRYIITSISSFIIDILSFISIYLLINNILISTVISRILSSLWNYNINSTFVFNKKSIRSTVMYYILASIIMLISGLAVTYLHSVSNVPVLFLKIFVDLILFIITYNLQKNVIFTRLVK